MRNKIFNTAFENMLRVLVLLDTVKVPINIDRIAALDFICIYGKKCRVLDKNLHGNNEFGFSEFSNKREKITEAIKLSVRNDYVIVEKSGEGFLYTISNSGRDVIKSVQSDYSKTYKLGAKIVCRRFWNYTDEGLLKYISEMATSSEER